MKFLWPQYLWLMLALPLLPVLYVWLLRRRGKPALRYSSLEVLREASGRHWRRHVPPALLLMACAVLLLAAARPTGVADAALGQVFDHAGHGRVAEHARDRRQADPPGGGAGSGEDLPARLAQEHRGRARHVRRQRPGRPALRRWTAPRWSARSTHSRCRYGTAVGNAIVLCLAELFPDHGINLGDMTFGPRQKARSRDDKDKRRRRSRSRPWRRAPTTPPRSSC